VAQSAISRTLQEWIVVAPSAAGRPRWTAGSWAHCGAAFLILGPRFSDPESLADPAVLAGLALVFCMVFFLGGKDRRKAFFWMVLILGAMYLIEVLFGQVGNLSLQTQKWIAIGIGVAVVVALLLFAAGLAWIGEIRSRRGDLAGTVLDPAGSPVPGALVTITHSEMRSRISRPANEQGEFLFRRISAGEYSVTATADGFSPSDPAYVRVEPDCTNQFTVSFGNPG